MVVVTLIDTNHVANGHVGNSYLLHPILALLSPSDFFKQQVSSLMMNAAAVIAVEQGYR